jgi:hypothetical protein
MDTLVAENFLFENTINRGGSDADTYMVKQKNFTQYIDQVRGQAEYSSGKVIIDAQSGNTTDVNDWYDAYVTLPYLYKLEVSASTACTIQSYDPNYLLTPKNCSLIESMRVEQGGRVIIEDCSNLSHLVSFRKHQTTTATSLNTASGDIYYPDSEFPESITASVAGVRNVSNSPTILSATASSIGLNTICNTGALMRQREIVGNNRVTTFVSAAAGLNEQATSQTVLPLTAASPTVLSTTAASPTTLSEVHYLAVIYLRDLSDYFAKHPLSKGGYKFTFTVNQAVTTITGASIAIGTAAGAPLGNAMTLTASTLTSGSTLQPCMANLGTSCVNSLSTCTNAAATVLTFTLTSKIDVSTGSGAAAARQAGVLLWVPSLTLSDKDEAKLLSQPIIYRTPYLINSGVYQNNGAGAPINLQLFNAITNPRALIVIPQYAQATGSQTQPSQCSPFNTCPGTPDPLSLTRVQVRVNQKPILPAPINYGWNTFIQNTAQLFTINGGLSPMTSGQINLSKWLNLYRYYAFDLSLTSADQRDIPQMITFEAFNNSAVIIDLYVFVLYEQDAMFNIANATVQMGSA